MKRSFCPTRVWLVTTLALCCVALFARDTNALNLKLKGVNYDFRQGPDYDVDRCKASAKISKEIKLLSTITPRVRIYSVSDCNVRPVLKYAKLYNMTVWMGVWVGNTTKTFDKELKTLTALVSEGVIDSELVVGVNVGSEALYRNDSTPEQLIANLKSVKELFAANNLSSIPLSITDTLSELLNNPSVIEAVDIVTSNIFPFWSKVPIADAMMNLNASVMSLAKAAGRKEFVITETGWATDGYDSRASVASPENAAKYLDDFFILAEKSQWMYYYFSAIDTPYRKEVENNLDTVEAHFGLFNVGYKLNKPYLNLVINGTSGEDGQVEELPEATSSPTPTTSGGSAPPSPSLPLALVALMTVLATALL